MQFSLFSTLTALVACASAANIIELVNQDSVERTVYFTPSAPHAAVQAVTLSAGKQTASVTFPTGWIGNWYAISKGASNTPGMLGEIAWNGWAGANYFDVSAIVDPNDHNGVKMMYPKISQKPLSGCQSFPCDNAYNKWDDIQTLSTTETTIVCLLGNKPSVSRRHPREFVTGEHSE